MSLTSLAPFNVPMSASPTKRLSCILLFLVGVTLILLSLIAWFFSVIASAISGSSVVLRGLVFVFTFGGVLLPQTSSSAGDTSIVPMILLAMGVLISVGSILLYRNAGSEPLQMPGMAQASSVRPNLLLFWKHSGGTNAVLAGICMLFPLVLVLPVALISAIFPRLYPALSVVSIVVGMASFAISPILLFTAGAKAFHSLFQRVAKLLRRDG